MTQSCSGYSIFSHNLVHMLPMIIRFCRSSRSLAICSWISCGDGLPPSSDSVSSTGTCSALGTKTASGHSAHAAVPWIGHRTISRSSMLYSTVGAMHSNEQEAQQYNFVAMMPLIISVILAFSVINAPSSTFSVVVSFIPLFTPLILLARVAVGAVTPLEIVFGYAVLIAFVALEIWFSARIYRVGILMYGKRPSLPELLRWARY